MDNSRPQQDQRSMLHREITGKVLEACFDVSNELGCGFLESVYQNALLILLRQRSINTLPNVHLDVFFRDEKIGVFVADLLVEGKVIVELKAVQSLLPEHQAQTINYLRASGLNVGLLINFGRPKIEYKRLTWFPTTVSQDNLEPN